MAALPVVVIREPITAPGVPAIKAALKPKARLLEGEQQPGLMEGAMFVRELSRSAIFHMECVNPFKKCKVFDLSHTNKEPLTLEQVPVGYRPYSGCLFVRKDILKRCPTDKNHIRK